MRLQPQQRRFLPSLRTMAVLVGSTLIVLALVTPAGVVTGGRYDMLLGVAVLSLALIGLKRRDPN